MLLLLPNFVTARCAALCSYISGKVLLENVCSSNGTATTCIKRQLAKKDSSENLQKKTTLKKKHLV